MTADLVAIRLADPDVDGAGVAEVYRPAVETSIVTFEEVTPTADEMAERVRKTLAWTPWLVAEADGRVIGYGYASRHRDRPGYRWSVDVSAYLAPDWQGRGIGKRLYTPLFQALREQRFVNAYAGITPPNPASEGLHRAFGMEPIGVYRRVGYKFGKWLDVGWYGVRLTEPADPPEEPIPFPDYLALPAGRAWLERMAESKG